MTEKELAEFQKEMDEQGDELREALADDLGGDPEDYRVDRTVAADGGDGSDRDE